MLALAPAQCEVVNVDLTAHAVVFRLRSRDPVQLAADLMAAISPAGLTVPPFDWVPADATAEPAATAAVATVISVGTTASTTDDGMEGGDPAGRSTTSGDGSKADDAFSLLYLVVFAACVIVVVVLISMAAGQFCSRRADGAATPQGGDGSSNSGQTAKAGLWSPHPCDPGTYATSPDYGSPLSYGEYSEYSGGGHPGHPVGGDHFVSIHALVQHAASQAASVPLGTVTLESNAMYDPAVMAGMRPHRIHGGRRLSYMDEQSVANPVFTGRPHQTTA